jgi:hypothetical protein
MDLHFSREDMIFRDQARTWLRENLIRERRPHSGEAMRSCWRIGNSAVTYFRRAFSA